MTDFAAVKAAEDEFQLATYKKMEIAVERGRGSWIWTAEGDKYLDLYGGHAVCATGHSHPRVVEAISGQAEKLLFYSNLVYSRARADAAEHLASVAPDTLKKVFFCNSGTEANENAMRIARITTGRKKVVSFHKGFHGRTADSISATFLGKYRTLGEPNVPFHEACEFGDVDAAKAIIDQQTAAVLIEPIQSMAGVREADPGYFISLREACDRVGALLIFDEVQTGIGRTGNWFFGGSELAGGVEPDVITLAKSLGSGVPVGACLVNARAASAIKENDLGTTFGGGMIAMAAVSATLSAIEEDGMIANAHNVDAAIREGMRGVSGVRSVRGKGCLLGIEFEGPSVDVHKRLLDKGVITGTSSDPNVLRLLPPLNLSEDEIAVFLEALR